MNFETISTIGMSYAVLQAVGLSYLYAYFSRRVSNDARNSWIRLFRGCFVLATIGLTVGLFVAFWLFPPRFEPIATPVGVIASDASLMYTGMNGAILGFAFLLVALVLGAWLGRGHKTGT